MAFTYDLTALPGQVRFELGDTVDATVSPGAGVRPDGSNFTDAEVDYFLTREGQHVMRAVAAACETLARQWGNAVSITVGSRTEAFDGVASKWADRGRQLRQSYGVTLGATDDSVVTVVEFDRNDAYNNT